jgi:murein DD-endopeptidase MepM/ murein hydrolase activator NlpD
MVRLVVLTGLLVAGAWLAREAGWITWPLPATLGPASPHEIYRRSLERAGLADTLIGQAWLDASERALKVALPVPLPTRERLSIDSTDPEAWGYRVALKRGQRVEVLAQVASRAPASAFVDVFELGAELSDEPDHATGALRAATYEAEEDREMLVRVQPELLHAGTLEVTLRAAPALRFPVANASVRNLQSVFGDPRDAGRRQHEGVDIFARRGTPVVSASDGIVLRVGETDLGGRVVWIWDVSRGLRLYYAHLHEQLVTTGQRVNAGDVLGTVGNTGNARTTPPHLHFGIYERGTGAIDPYWFIAPPRADTSNALR